jgi:hypothetical protein
MHAVYTMDVELFSRFQTPTQIFYIPEEEFSEQNESLNLRLTLQIERPPRGETLQ